MPHVDRSARLPPLARRRPREPGVSLDGARFLAEAGVACVGADNIAFEQMPSTDEGNWTPVHTHLLAEAGIPMMEVMDLEQLASERI